MSLFVVGAARGAAHACPALHTARVGVSRSYGVLFSRLGELCAKRKGQARKAPLLLVSYRPLA